MNETRRKLSFTYLALCNKFKVTEIMDHRAGNAIEIVGDISSIS